jgi:hypothetical protein
VRNKGNAFTLSDNIKRKAMWKKQTTLESFLIKPVKEKSVMGKEPNDSQPGSPGLQILVMVEDDEKVVDN